MAGPLDDFLYYIQNNANGSFNPYAAGDKRYGMAAGSAPNIGPTANREGYKQRDLQKRARRNAMLRRMKAMQQGKSMTPEVLRSQQPGTFRN